MDATAWAEHTLRPASGRPSHTVDWNSKYCECSSTVPVTPLADCRPALLGQSYNLGDLFRLGDHQRGFNLVRRACWNRASSVLGVFSFHSGSLTPAHSRFKLCNCTGQRRLLLFRPFESYVRQGAMLSCDFGPR